MVRKNITIQFSFDEIIQLRRVLSSSTIDEDLGFYEDWSNDDPEGYELALQKKSKKVLSTINKSLRNIGYLNSKNKIKRK